MPIRQLRGANRPLVNPLHHASCMSELGLGCVKTAFRKCHSVATWAFILASRFGTPRSSPELVTEFHAEQHASSPLNGELIR